MVVASLALALGIMGWALLKAFISGIRGHSTWWCDLECLRPSPNTEILQCCFLLMIHAHISRQHCSTPRKCSSLREHFNAQTLRHLGGRGKLLLIKPSLQKGFEPFPF